MTQKRKPTNRHTTKTEASSRLATLADITEFRNEDYATSPVQLGPELGSVPWYHRESKGLRRDARGVFVSWAVIMTWAGIEPGQTISGIAGLRLEWAGDEPLDLLVVHEPHGGAFGRVLRKQSS